MTWMSKSRELFSVGIDISDASIKALVIKHAVSGVSIENCARMSVPSSLLTAKDNKYSNDLIQALKQLRKEFTPVRRRVVAALSDQLVINKTIAVPRLLSNFEIEAEIAMALSDDQTNPQYDLCFDYKIRDYITDKDSKIVTFIAAKRSIVRLYQQAFLEADWPLTILDVESHAIATVWPTLANNYKVMDQTIAIFDFGRMRGLLTIINQGVADFHRHINLAGMHLTQQFANYYQCSVAEAEKMKLNGCYSIDCQVKIVKPFLQLITKQLQHWLQYLTIGERAQTINTLFLTGGTANLVGLDSWLAQELSVTIKKIDPLESCKFISSQIQNKTSGNTSEWFLSYILAIRGVTHARI
jgi:type IV pilus assembly protein PilM